MAPTSIILCLVALSLVAMASATTPAPKKKDPGHIIVQGTILCKQGNKPIAGIQIYFFTIFKQQHYFFDLNCTLILKHAY